MKKAFGFVAVLVCACSFAGPARGSLLTITASDNADGSSYSPQPDHNWSVTNGGIGYGLWTPLADTGGGGTFMEGVGVNNRQVDGNFSFALYAGGGSYDISRPLVNPQPNGEFEINTRFDLAGAGPNLVNLRAGNITSGFGAGELLSFGIVNGNQLSYTDGSGFHLFPSGEARGARWHCRSITTPTTARTRGRSATWTAALGRPSAAAWNQTARASARSPWSTAARVAIRT